MTRPVLLLGIPTEPPLALAAAALEHLGVEYVTWNQRSVGQSRCELHLDEDGIAGHLLCADWGVALEDVVGVYTRLTDWTLLPELAGCDPDDAVARHAGAVHAALDTWLDAAEARVVNRARANDSNNSKPYQALLIRRYFHVPDTLVTNDPSQALAFCAEHARTIYKSISGERSIVTEFGATDVERLHLLRNGPVQFQEWVGGFDVRVHVVGGSHIFATRVDSTAIDYRYDHSAAGASFTAFDLPADVAAASIALTEELELGLAGLDLRFADDGRVVCFEVNPSPAYSVYESATGQPISRALAAYVAGV